MTGVECPNCHATMLGRPCSVCGYWSPRRRIYPTGHDALTDSYQRPTDQTEAYTARDGVSITPPHETTRLPLTPVVAGSSHPRGVSAR